MTIEKEDGNPLQKFKSSFKGFFKKLLSPHSGTNEENKSIEK